MGAIYRAGVLTSETAIDNVRSMLEEAYDAFSKCSASFVQMQGAALDGNGPEPKLVAEIAERFVTSMWEGMSALRCAQTTELEALTASLTTEVTKATRRAVQRATHLRQVTTPSPVSSTVPGVADLSDSAAEEEE